MAPTRIKLTFVNGGGFASDRVYRVVDDPRSYINSGELLHVSPQEFAHIVCAEIASGRLIGVEVLNDVAQEAA